MQMWRARIQSRRPALFVRAGLLLLFISAISGSTSHSAWAQKPANAPFDILVISSWNKAIPWTASFDKGLNAGLRASGRKAKVFVEYLDAARFKEGSQQTIFERYLRDKYAGKRIGVVVTEGLPAADFIAQRADAFVGAKRVFVQPGAKAENWLRGNGGDVTVPVVQDFGASGAEMLRRVSPKKVYVAADATRPSGARRLAAFKKAWAENSAGVDTEYLVDLPMVDLLTRVSALPAKSAIFYLPIFQDGAGKRFVPKLAAKAIAARANAPVFSNWEALVGSGVVGGYLLSGERVGKITAGILAGLVGGGEFRYKPGDAYGYVYDWRQLKRWGIAESNLPKTADVRYRSPSVFEQYTWEITSALIAMLVLSVFSAALLVVNRKRKWAMAALQSERESLEERVAERTRELKIARERADASNEAKSQFLAAMSHEIRTPMSGVMGFADMLLDSGLRPENEEKVVRIKESTLALMTIINDILDISKMEAGKLEIENVDFHLPSFMVGVTEMFHEANDGGAGGGLEIVLHLADDLPEGIRSDSTRLRQVLVNLLGNAVKFTESGIVELTAELDKRVDGQPQLKFLVRDTGIGMTEETIAKLFTDFTQADASITRTYEGTGLGLSICKRLVEMIGGEIGVESEIGKGSTFWFTIPYVPAVEVVRDPSRSETCAPISFRANRALNILVAEDNEINQRIIKFIVEAFGHRLEVVSDGAQAVQAHKTQDFDLILMDVRMPNMSGPDATRAIRQLPGAKNQVPIIALTADAMEENQKIYIAAGMNACVTKPIDRVALVGAIDTVMGEEIHLAVADMPAALPQAKQRPAVADDEENPAVKAFLEEIDVTDR